MMLLPLFSSLVLLVKVVEAGIPYNALAQTPQMGWDDWNAYGCDVSQDLLLGTAQKMVELGLRDAGYHYVILDDCWSAGRSANGTLIPDPQKFPNGMANVADTLHNMGLGFGMYSSAGTYTCARYAGSLGYEMIDAHTFAGWGVDYLKYDNCYNQGQFGTPKLSFDRYKAMSDALNSTGRQMLYSMCQWGEDQVYQWAQTIANSYRISGDIGDSFDEPNEECPCSGDEGYDCLLPGFHCPVMNILNKVSSFVSKAIPGSWNDLDNLEVGNGGMTDEEYKTHMTMWAAAKSPLIMGLDVSAMTPSALSILTNPAVLAISQDPLGTSVARQWRYFVPDTDQYGQGEIQMWSGPLSNNDYVMILLNGGALPRSMNATLKDIFTYGGNLSYHPAAESWNLYDLWGNTMNNATASEIIDNNSTEGVVGLFDVYFNATATSFADGIAAQEPLLMGTYATSVAPMGTVTVDSVPAHGVAAFRMKQAPKSTTPMSDEL